jgi:hypothetical protein
MLKRKLQHEFKPNYSKTAQSVFLGDPANTNRNNSASSEENNEVGFKLKLFYRLFSKFDITLRCADQGQLFPLNSDPRATVRIYKKYIIATKNRFCKQVFVRIGKMCKSFETAQYQTLNVSKKRLKKLYI